MRNIVPPLPLLRCDFCHDELLLKGIEPNGSFSERDTATMACLTCGQQRTLSVTRDRNTARYASRTPTVGVG